MKTIDILINIYEFQYINVKEIIGTSNLSYFNEEYNYLSKLNDEKILNNLEKLVKGINIIREKYKKKMYITSGFRNPEHNKKVGGAIKSAHTLGLACDVRDNNGDLDRFLLNNQQLLKDIGASIEHPAYTKGWCHIDFMDRKKEVFIPYSGEIKKQYKDNDFIKLSKTLENKNILLLDNKYYDRK